MADKASDKAAVADVFRQVCDRFDLIRSEVSTARNQVLLKLSGQVAVVAEFEETTGLATINGQTAYSESSLRSIAARVATAAVEAASKD